MEEEQKSERKSKYWFSALYPVRTVEHFEGYIEETRYT